MIELLWFIAITKTRLIEFNKMIQQQQVRHIYLLNWHKDNLYLYITTYELLDNLPLHFEQSFWCNLGIPSASVRQGSC